MNWLNSLEKASWLSKANPYKQEYMREAFKFGARSYWTGANPKYRGNSRERVAFSKGYAAAWRHHDEAD